MYTVVDKIRLLQDNVASGGSKLIWQLRCVTHAPEYSRNVSQTPLLSVDA